MNVLPRSLRALIDEARESIASGDGVFSEDELAEFPDDMREVVVDTNRWLQELSEGKYSQQLYRRCVAEDCEENCDWEGAEKGYLAVVSHPESEAHDKWLAHGKLSCLLGLIGRIDKALGHACAATDAAVAMESEVAQQMSIAEEAWLLVALERVHGATRRARQGQALKLTMPHRLGDATLLSVLAACDVQQRRLWRAGWKLRRAWRLLRWSDSDVPPGIESARGTWWRVEAGRRRAERDNAGEIEALRQSVAIARRLTEDPVGSHVYCDARLMRTLFAMADALQRGNRQEEAAPLLDEAHAIQRRWKLPEAALQRRCV